MVLAQQGEVGVSAEYVGWYVGLGIGFVVVVAVVVLVAIILTVADRIGTQARTGVEAVDEARVTTLAVWEVPKINASAVAILRAAEAARKHLGG